MEELDLPELPEEEQEVKPKAKPKLELRQNTQVKPEVKPEPNKIEELENLIKNFEFFSNQVAINNLVYNRIQEITGKLEEISKKLNEILNLAK